MNLLLDNFRPVSLDTTNRLAKMLNRIDNKYVLNQTQYTKFLGKLSNRHGVLKIENRNEFQYSSCYYDDNFRCYFDHHQARRKRVKIRTREYLNSGSIYFEVKLKGLRGRTDKHRTDCVKLIMPRIVGEHFSMLTNLYSEKYQARMPLKLSPSLLVNYSRCTLVSLTGGERVTVDFDLQFKLPNSQRCPIRINRNFIIVETKSETGRGIADDALKKIGVRRASKCSKYCIGLNLTGAVTKNNSFLHTIKHIQKNVLPDTSASVPSIS